MGCQCQRSSSCVARVPFSQVKNELPNYHRPHYVSSLYNVFTCLCRMRSELMPFSLIFTPDFYIVYDNLPLCAVFVDGVAVRSSPTRWKFMQNHSNDDDNDLGCEDVIWYPMAHDDLAIICKWMVSVCVYALTVTVKNKWWQSWRLESKKNRNFFFLLPNNSTINAIVINATKCRVVAKNWFIFILHFFFSSPNSYRMLPLRLREDGKSGRKKKKLYPFVFRMTWKKINAPSRLCIHRTHVPNHPLFNGKLSFAFRISSTVVMPSYFFLYSGHFR